MLDTRTAESLAIPSAVINPYALAEAVAGRRIRWWAALGVVK